MRFVPIFTLIVLIMAPFSAFGAELAPVSLAKAGKWEMNYDVDSCHLVAKFGAGDGEITIRMTRVGPSDSFDLTLYGKPLATDVLRRDVEIAFGAQQGFIKRSALAGSAQIPRKVPLLMISNLRVDGKDYPAKDEPANADITPEQEAAINSIILKLSSRRHYRLETGPLGAVFRAMQQCTTNLVKSWGYDPDVQSKLSRPVSATGKPVNWLTTSDYPSTALQAGGSGKVVFRLDVDDTGKVGGCHVLYRTDPDEFADLTCKLLIKRATMSPALDAQGRPVRSFYIRSVIWAIRS